MLLRLSAVRGELERFTGNLAARPVADGGLGPALRAMAAQAPLTVEVAMDPERLSAEAEAVAWFVCAEALANTVKHAGATRVEMTIGRADGCLRVGVRDDGIGGADPRRGSGLRGIKERVETIGGRLSVESATGEGTRVIAELPLSGALVGPDVG